MKMMVSLTRKNGVTVRLDAAFDVEKETARYSVTVCGAKALYTKLEFGNFKSAAKVYKMLADAVENGVVNDEIELFGKLYGKAVA